MLKKILLLAVVLSLLLATGSGFAATYYVRTDGGTAEQCDGLSDAPYTPDADGHCAWSHPYWALTDRGEWKIQGGDTLVIKGGTYVLGFGAPNTSKWCSSYWPWSCKLPPIPSGTEDSPTRILGDCADPPKLVGVERLSSIFSLKGTQYAEIACFELTDDAACVEFHPNADLACPRGSFPFGPWAKAGVTASDSAHVTLRNLDVHGFANRGIIAYRLSDWRLEDVRIAGNGWSGWEGDAGPGQDSANTGNIVFDNVTVEWNGCVEALDGSYTGCQSGYGDGLGTGATGGHWIFRDCTFRYNTSDGLDLLYLKVGDDTAVEIENLRAYGNAGNQVKVRGKDVYIANSIIQGNCDYFEGKPFNYRVTSCRAGGDALAVHVTDGGRGAVVNSYLDGRGNVLVLLASLGQNSVFKIYNDILVGKDNFFNNNRVGMVYKDQVDPTAQIIVSHVIVHNLKDNSILPGEAIVNADPLLGDDLVPDSGSPAIDSGLPVLYEGLIPDVDIEGTARPQGQGVDLGPYEVGQGGGADDGDGECECDCQEAYRAGYEQCRQQVLDFFDQLLSLPDNR